MATKAGMYPDGNPLHEPGKTGSTCSKKLKGPNARPPGSVGKFNPVILPGLGQGNALVNESWIVRFEPMSTVWFAEISSPRLKVDAGSLQARAISVDATRMTTIPTRPRKTFVLRFNV